MRISISLIFILPVSNILSLISHHAINLSLGIYKCIIIVSRRQLIRNFCSYSPDLDRIFLMGTRSLLLMVPYFLTSRTRMCMERSTDAADHAVLLSISTQPVVVSSIYTSNFQSSSGTAMPRGGAWEKVMTLGSGYGAGTLSWTVEAISDGFQSSHFSSAFGRLVDVLEMIPHSFGNAASLKFSSRATREIGIVSACVIVWIVVFQL